MNRVEKVAPALVPGARCVVPNYNVQRFPLSKYKQRELMWHRSVTEMQAAGSHLATLCQYLSILFTGRERHPFERDIVTDDG